MQPFGLLNINKPAGTTSRKVVDHVVRLVRPAKAGHAGTLDPLATGVLVVCVGRATRLIEMVQSQTKVYRARFLLGRRSDTDDVEGTVVDVVPRPAVTREQIEAFLPRFIGRIQQVPPQYSAVHVGGRRAYDLARRGESVELQPRTVVVHRLALTGLSSDELELEIECGSGTYVRSIGRDLGDLLGCGAVMSGLVRTRVGPFRIEEAACLEELSRETISEKLLPAAKTVEHLPAQRCTEEELTAIRQGRAIPATAAATAGDTLALFAPEGSLAALAECGADGRLHPRQVFLA